MHVLLFISKRTLQCAILIHITVLGSTNTHTHTPKIHICIIYMQIYVCIYMCIYIYKCVCRCVYICIYIYIDILYIQICIHVIPVASLSPTGWRFQPCRVSMHPAVTLAPHAIKYLQWDVSPENPSMKPRFRLCSFLDSNSHYPYIVCML